MLIGLVVMVGASNVAAHTADPGNTLSNASFESGLASWSVTDTCGGVSLGGPGAQGTPTAVNIVNCPSGAYLVQTFASPLSGQTTVVLDFDAKIGSSFSTGHQGVVLRGTVGSSTFDSIVAALSFEGAWVKVLVYCQGPWVGGVGGPCIAASTTVPAPSTGAWHHYRLLVVPAAVSGLLYIDGKLVGGDTGDPTAVVPIAFLEVGDGCGSSSFWYCTPAPSMTYDEFYVTSN